MNSIKEEDLPIVISEHLRHGSEDTYLEYKGDIPWTDRKKQLEVLQTIFALANEKGGGAIVIGVEDNGNISGLSESNFSTYSHDKVNMRLRGKTNQDIQCKLNKYNVIMKDNGKEKRIVFIEVAESKEFPLIYLGGQELIDREIKPYGSNVALRSSALYIRNQNENGNKEIETIEEWGNLIERVFNKHEKETLRKYYIIRPKNENPYDKELKI